MRGTLRRRGLLATAMAVAASVAVVPAAYAGTWLAPADLSSPSSQVTRPDTTTCGLCAQPGAGGVDVAVDAQGGTVAAWTRRRESDGAQVVQASVRPPGGAFSAPQDLGTTDPNYDGGVFGAVADVAVDAQGGAVVAWPTPSGVIQAALRPPGGTFGAAANLSASGAADPRVAMGRGGHAIAVWVSGGVVEASSRAPGGTFAGAASLSAGSAAAPAVAVNEAGAAVVAWARGGDGSRVVEARVRPAGGGFASVRGLSEAGAGSADAGIDGQGRATVAWLRAGRVQGRSLDAAGGAGAGPAFISAAGKSSQPPRLAVNAGGTAVAAWAGCPGSGSKCPIESATQPPGGAFGAPAAVSTAADDGQSPSLAVAVSPRGDAAIAWSQLEGGPVRAVQRAPGGELSAPKALSPGGANAFAPALTAGEDGSFVAGWALFRPGNRQVAQAAAFDGAPPALTGLLVPASGVTGRPLTFSVEAADAWTGATVTWGFGDGASAAGGSVTHAYAKAGAYQVTLVAQDGAGNRAELVRTVQISGPTVAGGRPGSGSGPGAGPGAGPGSGLASVRIGARWKPRRTRTRLTRLVVSRLPANARVEVRCKGRGCPFARKRNLRARRGSVDARRAFGRRRSLRVGVVIEVRVTAPGAVGRVVRFTMRRSQRPRTTKLCLPPGARTPRRSC